MAPRGEPSPTPDSPRARAPGDARGGTIDPASRAPATGDGTEASKLWYEKLWEEHQRNTDATVKFFEEEHKKNVQKFEAAIEDIKKTAEEAVDGLQSQFEGRKSLKKLREERDAALKSMRDAQTKLVAASREVQAAETALKDAGGPKRAPQDAVKRCTLARSSLLLARSEFGAARAAKDAAETAVTRAEVQLAKQLKERNVMNLLFKRKLTPEEEEEERAQLEETRRISAALAIQRNYRARLEVKRQRANKAARRARAALAVFNVLRAVLYAFAIYLTATWAKTEGRYVAARIASSAKTAALDRWAVARGAATAFAPLTHDYARYGVASGIEAGENVVLRKRNRELRDSVASLESQLDSTRRALESTRSGDDALAGSCVGDVALATEANARARVAERRADALGVEVHALRALATRCGKVASRIADRSDGVPPDDDDDGYERWPMRAWLDDPGAGFSAQVARAAVDAASVASEERVRSAAEAARAAAEEADGFKIETELLRSLVDDGFLPGGSSGKSGWGTGGGTCWAEAAAAASRARAETAKDAAKAAKDAAARLMDEKLAAYAAARREAEARADEYAIELEALKATGPELAGVSSTGGLGASSSSSSSSSSTNGGLASGLATVPPFVVAHPDPNARLKIVGAAKLVAAARVASERVEQAAEALRDAEARAEARRIEVETLEFLVGGNGTASGAMDRARGYVVGAPKAAEAARDAAHALTHKRLRAEEEARAQAETRAEVYRVELASLRAVEAERAKANARRSPGGPFGTGSCALPPGVTRDGEVATLVKEVARLEKELDAAKSAAVGGWYAPPGSIADAAAASTRAANEAASEASSAASAASFDSFAVASSMSTKSPARRLAAFLISVVTGEPADLAFHNALLERRITAMSRRMASAAGPACAAALSDAIDDRIDAERHAAALQNELDAAQRLTQTVAAESLLGGDAAAEALRAASDAHRMLLVKERHVAKASLETCRSHAAAAQERAFAAALAARHASELSERRERELELERVEDRKDRAIRRAMSAKTRSTRRGAPSGDDDLDDLDDLDDSDDPFSETSKKNDDEENAFWPELPASLAALESAYEAARDDAFRLESTVETLRGRVREAERRARVAPGTADAYAPRVEPWGLFNWLVCSAFFLTLLANRRVVGLVVAHALLRARASRAAARVRDLKVQLDAAVDAAAVARQRLYQNVSDEKAIGTTVDELRASIRAHAALNDAIRADNDGLRKQLLDASAFDSEAHYASVVAERHTAELLRLRAEVEKLRAARLDVAAEAAVKAAAGFEEMGDVMREGGAVASHRLGVFAARDAAEREATALREEAKALREANESLLAASEKLRLENHELLSELIEDGTLTQGLSAYQAAKFLKQQAVEAGEQAAAERIVRTELARRFTRLVAEAKNARYSTAFIFLGASVAVGLVTYAHLRVDAMSATLSPAPAPLRFIAPHLTVLGALTAFAFALWAVAYSKPSPEAAAAMTPITRVALVDEDDVELVEESDWTRTLSAEKRRARRVAPPSRTRPSTDERSRPAPHVPPEERITERLDIRELQAAVVGADAMTKPSSWGAGLAEAALSAGGFRSPDEHPEAAEERRARDVEIARIRRELQHAKQHAARVRNGKPPSRAGWEASGGESSGRRGGTSDQPARLSVFKAKDVILTEQEERAAMAAAEASAREGSLQSQVDMLRDKNELMSKELAKLRRKVARAEEEAEAARAEGSLQASMSTRNSPGVSMRTSGRASPSTSPTAAPAPVSPAAVKQALKKKGR